MLALLVVLAGATPSLECLAQHPDDPQVCEVRPYAEPFRLAFMKACSEVRPISYCACLVVLGPMARLSERDLVKQLMDETGQSTARFKIGPTYDRYSALSAQCHAYERERR